MIWFYRFFGALYLISGLWCIFQLELVTTYLGFTGLTELGKSEFFSVYGGLQIGLGSAVILASFRSGYLEASVYFSAVFSSFLAIFRIISFVIYGGVEDLIYMLALEVFLSVSLWFVWIKAK